MNFDKLIQQHEIYHVKTDKIEQFVKELSQMELYKNSNLTEKAQELEGLKSKFKNPNLVISVVAEVSSGKSTFLNALIFKDKVLHSAPGATTATIFKIVYGDTYKITTPIGTTECKDIQELRKETIKYNELCKFIAL